MDILAALVVCALGLTAINFGNHNSSAVSMLMGTALIAIGGSYIIFIFFNWL